MIKKLPNFIIFTYDENWRFTTMGTHLFQLAQQTMKSYRFRQTFFDRESISHGPTSWKIVVVVGDLRTLLKVTFNVTVLILILNKSPKDLKSQKVPESLEKSQNVTNLTVKHL